jgi:Ca2+-binding EF-hand superfamily protein
LTRATKKHVETKKKQSIESNVPSASVSATGTTAPSATAPTKSTEPKVKASPSIKTTGNAKTQQATAKEPIESTPSPEPTITSTTVPIPDVVQQIDIPDKTTAMKLFDELDENASGKLSLAELDKGIVTLFPDVNNKPAIMAAYKAADRSNNGFVERKEFGYFLRYIVYYNNLWSLFAAVDIDGDRRITRDEFVATFDKHQLARDAQEVFDEIDTNKGGMILFDELVHWMATTNNTSMWSSEEIEELLAGVTKPTTKNTVARSAPEAPIPKAVQQIVIPGKEKAMQVFDELDENASGKLSLAELDKGIVNLFADFNNKPAIMAAYKAADRSNNGFVERKEFGYFLRYIVYYNNLWSLFAAVDIDGDRRITRDEFVATFDKHQLARDAQEVFDEIDTNKGGMILFDELVHWMATTNNTSMWSSEEIEELLAGVTKPTTKNTVARSAPEAPIPKAVQQIVIPGKEKAMQVFDELDENASGKLSLAELDKGIVTLFADFNNKPAIMAAYKAADRSNNGFVERKEFGYFLRYIVYYNNLWSLFSFLDDDSDRRITLDEFTDAADLLALPRDAQDIFHEIDANGGGMILFQEFVDWMATNEPTFKALDKDDMQLLEKILDDESSF